MSTIVSEKTRILRIIKILSAAVFRGVGLSNILDSEL